MRLLLLAFSATLALAACTEAHPMPTERQALQRVEQLIHEAVSTIKPPPELDLFQPSLNRRRCVDPNDGGSDERIIVNRRYYLRGIPKDRFIEVAEAVKSHWQHQGNIITNVSGMEANEPVVSGRSRPDDYLLSLSWIQGDVLGIAVTSTCVWPDGTPAP